MTFPPPGIGDMLLVYAALLVSFYGWGKLASKVLGLGLQFSPDYCFDIAWMGWAILLGVLQALHLLWPVNWQVSGLVYLVGFVGGTYGILADIRNRIKSAKPVKITSLVLFVSFMTLVACWSASRGLTSTSSFDSGLYHFNALRWINSYPIVPGLGNLHSRLGYNLSPLVYTASLNFFPYFPYGHAVANSLLFLLAFATLAWQFSGLTAGTPQDSVHRISSFLGLVIVSLLSRVSDVAEPSPDLPSCLIQVVVFVWFVHAVVRMRSGTLDRHRLCSLLILASTLITMKLSNLVFAVCLAGTYLALAFIRDRSQFFSRHVRVISLVMLMLAVWVVRGVLLSGYPAFPLPWAGADVDWRVPAERAQEEVDWISSWARLPERQPSEVLGNSAWVGPWLSATYRTAKIEVVYPLFLAVGTAAVAFLLAFVQGRMRLLLSNSILMLPIVIGLVHWLFVAPDPRFAHSLLYLLPLSAAVVTVLSTPHLEGSRITRRAAFRIVAVLACFLVGRRIPLNSPLVSRYADFPKPSLIEKTTNSGLHVYVAESDTLCWDSPLPCMPEFNPELSLRTQGDLASGFTVK